MSLLRHRRVLRLRCDVRCCSASAAARCDASWRCCGCRWCMRSLQGLKVALLPSAPAIRALLARFRLSANTVVISPRPADDTAISVHIAASRGSKWSCSWASCSSRLLWRYLRGLHRKHSHCTARGCVVSSEAAAVAPQVGTEHQSSTAHSACAERMTVSQSTAQSRHRHRSALGGWAGLDWCVAAAACRSALDEFDPSSRPRPTRPFSSTFAALQRAQRRSELANGRD